MGALVAEEFPGGCDILCIQFGWQSKFTIDIQDRQGVAILVKNMANTWREYIQEIQYFLNITRPYIVYWFIG